MKRRIVVAIVVVAGLAVLAFGVPLGVVIDRQFESQALLRLERAAILAERDVPADWRPGEPLTLSRAGGDTSLAVYDGTGTRVTGDGPAVGDEPVRTALADDVGEAENGTSYVISVPLTDGGAVLGAVRAEQALRVTDRRIRAAWASMGLLAAAVVGGSVLLARRLARRISVPIDALQAGAAQLGTESQSAPVSLPRSGMAEIDDVAAALEESAARIGESVDRERAFSAEVSHQLRTPITGLRLLIETEVVAPRADPTAILGEMASSVGRLEATVDDLLSLARNRPTDRHELHIGALLAELDQRWQRTYAEAGRSLRVVSGVPGGGDPVIVASRSALGHILDVLVDNALRHGAGEVTVSGEHVGGGLALRVADEGTIDDDRVPHLFDRNSGGSPDAASGRNLTPGPGRHGIGLRLARRLAQAEGGDLVCSGVAPTSFSLLLVAVQLVQVQPV